MFFFQAEDGIRDLVRSRGLGDVYKRQVQSSRVITFTPAPTVSAGPNGTVCANNSSITLAGSQSGACLLYTSDAADERSSVDLGGRRIIKKKTTEDIEIHLLEQNNKGYKTYTKYR